MNLKVEKQISKNDLYSKWLLIILQLESKTMLIAVSFLKSALQ